VPFALDQIFQVSGLSAWIRAKLEVCFALTKQAFDLKNFLYA
jgi:hypothetical protein